MALLKSFLLEDIRKNFFLERVVRHCKRTAWGSGGVPMTGGTEETCGCVTEGQGLVVGLSRSGQWMDLIILKVFPA